MKTTEDEKKLIKWLTMGMLSEGEIVISHQFLSMGGMIIYTSKDNQLFFTRGEVDSAKHTIGVE